MAVLTLRLKNILFKIFLKNIVGVPGLVWDHIYLMMQTICLYDASNILYGPKRILQAIFQDWCTVIWGPQTCVFGDS